MQHNLVMIEDSGGMATGCTRCGADTHEALDKPCPAQSDGDIFARLSARAAGKPLNLDDLGIPHFPETDS